MQPRTDSLHDRQLVQDLDRACIPQAAHEEILNGNVVIGNGTITFGAWSFPATPAYLIEIFNLIDRHNQERRRQQLSGALSYLRGTWGCTYEQLLRISGSFEIEAPVLNLLPFRYRITW